MTIFLFSQPPIHVEEVDYKHKEDALDVGNENPISVNTLMKDHEKQNLLTLNGHPLQMTVQ